MFTSPITPLQGCRNSQRFGLGALPQAITCRRVAAQTHAARRVAAQTHAARRGAATIVAIAVLAILAGIMTQQTRRVLMERRQMRNEIAYLQTEKLAEAGLVLAEKSKLKDPAWTGLTWNLPPGSIHQTNSAEVVITVQGDSCTVVASYPANADIPFQVTRTRKLTP